MQNKYIHENFEVALVKDKIRESLDVLSSAYVKLRKIEVYVKKFDYKILKIIFLLDLNENLTL
ncbi:hypothetical protein IEQ34_018347 [Dendrobium chrysotoxum]|uniref:Uncharacterized protein n=1 Tax=Dendrobium chrysotoxum TaxID=161865 RepID=A0AAV7GF58_DENCH|nr:hypothetical protein IEQ34_018347 [Dendrobium chrysotoxum]